MIVSKRVTNAIWRQVKDIKKARSSLQEERDKKAAELEEFDDNLRRMDEAVDQLISAAQNLCPAPPDSEDSGEEGLDESGGEEEGEDLSEGGEDDASEDTESDGGEEE